MKAVDILNKYRNFFENRKHVRIENSPLIPLNDPTTLFTSSGMQPLVSYLLGEEHPDGKRLVNVQNCFRAQDIDEVGDNRHTTFFRMLGNWSLGDYFKEDQISWFWKFITDKKEGLGLSPEKLFITVFEGNGEIPKDREAIEIWSRLLSDSGLDPKERIFEYGVDKNWWSRSGVPDNMPVGEPGGPDTEVFYEFDVEHNTKFGKKCHVNCNCGKYLEIGNSVFMQYVKTGDGFNELSQKNVDFGGGLERLVAATENKQDIFETSLFNPIIETIENLTAKKYSLNNKAMRTITDHLISSCFMIAASVIPSNKDQGYVLRRLLRRSFDNLDILNSFSVAEIVERVVEQYKDTDEYLITKLESIKNTILEEEDAYRRALSEAKRFIQKKYPLQDSKKVKQGDELKGITEISSDDAFFLYASHGLSPVQIESLGFVFDRQKFAEKLKEHQEVSRKGANKKFAGGLADHSDLTVKGHTATHLMHQALRDILGDSVHQTGSNITVERIRFDFAFDRKLTDEEIKKVEDGVREKISSALPVHYEIMDIEKAKKLKAIGLFDEKYGDKVKIYFIGAKSDDAYSKEFCGGPHVRNTSDLKSFAIVKEEGISRGVRRIYAKVT